MIRQLFLLIIVFLTACNGTSVSSYPAVDVIEVRDGDTITVQENQTTTAIKLACIDAPETSQQGGQEATNYLKQLISAGKTVGLKKIREASNGVTVGEIYRNGDSINLKLVQQGQAVVDPLLLEACSDKREQFLAAEQRAKSANLGFWRQGSRMPWEYRQQEGIEPETTNFGTSTNRLPPCVDNDCDCFDFSSHREAQRVLEAFSGDPHRLDADGNGIACDNLY